MSNKRKPTHLSFNGKPLCGEKNPRSDSTTTPALVTCRSCHRGAARRVSNESTSERDRKVLVNVFQRHLVRGPKSTFVILS